MPLRSRLQRRPLLSPAGIVALVALSGCSSIGDLGQLNPATVTDDMHAWVGHDAAASVGAPTSTYPLTDDERTLRDLAFPLIEPPYDRQRWDAVVLEYGDKREFRQGLWVYDPTAYYVHLRADPDRSVSARYNQLIDDIRNDIVRIQPFFAVARTVLDLDRRRTKSMQLMTDLSPPERANALARIGENSLTIAWVHHSLNARCAGYRFALDHLVAAEPEDAAAEADRVLTELQQAIAAYPVVAEPLFAAIAAPHPARHAPVVQ